jgi:hypothetical protein
MRASIGDLLKTEQSKPLSLAVSQFGFSPPFQNEAGFFCRSRDPHPLARDEKWEMKMFLNNRCRTNNGGLASPALGLMTWQPRLGSARCAFSHDGDHQTHGEG